MALVSADARLAFRERAGFSIGALPLIVVLGYFFVAATVPALFTVLASKRMPWKPLEQVFDLAVGVGVWISSMATSVGVNEPNGFLIELGLYAVAAIVAASVIRSLVVGTPRPALLTVAAMAAGIFSIPLLAWFAVGVTLIVRVAIWLQSIVVTFLEWARPALKVLTYILVGGFLLVAVATVAYFFFRLLSVLFKEMTVSRAIIFVAVLAGVTVAARTSIWPAVRAPLVSAARHIGSLISTYLLPTVAWIVVAALYVVVGLVVAGAIIATLGFTGRQVYLPLRSAGEAGVRSEACVDLAAGAGVFSSLILCGAVLDSDFSLLFRSAWSGAVVSGWAPAPDLLFQSLMPDSAERLLTSWFVGYSPNVDCMVVILAGAIGAVAMTLSKNEWETDSTTRYFSLIIVAVGVAIAAAIPLLLLTVFARVAGDG